MIERTLYERTQRGYVVPVATALSLVLLVLVRASPLQSQAMGRLLEISILIVIAAGFAFSSLTVKVTNKTLSWWFTVKAIGVKVSLDRIREATTVKTNLFEGIGIHLTWHGWLWNVAGDNAVGIRIDNGTRFAIGTGEPDVLLAAIQRAKTEPAEAPST